MRLPGRSWVLLFCAAVVAVAVAGFANVAHAGEEQELEAAQGQVDQREFEKASKRLAKMLDPAAPVCPKDAALTPEGCRLAERAFIRSARGLYARALHGLKRPQEAKAQFKALLLDDPTYTPSPAAFSLELINLFTEAKNEAEADIQVRLIAEQKKKKEYEDALKDYEAWIDEMADLAAKETVVRERSRLVAAVPFGVGQFQNGSIGWGIFFASLEATFTAGAIATGFLHADLAACAYKNREDPGECVTAPTPDEAKVALDDRLDVYRIVNATSMALLGASILAGIIEAEVNFDSTQEKTRARKVRKKPKKPVPPASMPTVTGVPGAPDAYGLGISVKF